MVDPTTLSIITGLISTGITSGLSKAANKIFRPEEVADFLKSTAFQGTLDHELLFLEEYEEINTDALKIFFQTDEVISIFSQIFQDDSKKSINEIESEFVQVFCKIKPIKNKSNEEFARRLFSCIRQACNAFLQLKIHEGKFIALDYKNEARQKELIDGQNRIEKILGDVASEVKTPQGYISSKVPLEYFDEEFKESIALVEKNEIEEAKTKLLAIIGILENKPQENKKLLSRAYHLLAISYNKNKEIGGNFGLAEHYAKRSLEYDPLNDKVKGTLASIYINLHGKENFEKSFSIAAPLWEQSDKKNPQFLEVYLWGLFLTKSAADAIAFFEGSNEAQDLTEKNDLLSNVIARFYIVMNNPRHSLQYINNSIKLDPDNSDHYGIKASAYRDIAFAEDYVFSDFELCPKFKKYDCIEKSLKCYQKALSISNKNTESLLIERIKKEIYTCSSILNRSSEREFQQIRFNINSSLLPENEQKTLEFIDFVNELNARHFTSASQKLLSLKEWEMFSYETKNKMGLIFAIRGSSEEAKKIFQTLEHEADIKKDIRFWINMSVFEALLGNKSGMLQYLEKAKEASIGSSEWEERVLTHRFALINRYRDTGKEVDRMLDSIQEYDKKFPNRKILKAIPVNENEEKPPQEIIDIFKKAQERDLTIKKICVEHHAPTYLLADAHHLIYPEMMKRLNDPSFHIPYHPQDQISQREMGGNFDLGEIYIFDYSSLLNLVKMNLLSELEKTHKRLLIPKSLFEQIQSDLIVYEDPDLRRLWDFLRNTNIISIVDITADPIKYQELSEHLGKWVPDLIELVIENKNSVLIADDLNFIRLTKSYALKGTTTFFFLTFLFEKKYIDAKTYGNAIGILAERMYIILPFDGEDLFNIVMDDECKIRLRTYHLINHITIREVTPSFYSRQFEYFIDKLWRSGSLFEDKMNWLSLIVERMLFAINQRRELEQMAEAEILLLDLKKIIKNIVPLCRLSELTTLEEKCPELFKNDSTNTLLGFALSFIKERKVVFSKSDT